MNNSASSFGTALPIAIETFRIDGAYSQYAAFLSHNQRVVSNSHGIFLTYLTYYHAEPPESGLYYTTKWRLLHSVTNGMSWRTIGNEWQEQHTKAPALETDELDNLYLVNGKFPSSDASFIRLLASEQYYNPHTTPIFNESTIPDGGADKSCMLYDRTFKRFYYFHSHSNDKQFHVISPDGTVNSTVYLLNNGQPRERTEAPKPLPPDEHGVPQFKDPLPYGAAHQYPLLALGEDRTLHMAWTSQVSPGLNPGPHHDYQYWSIHHLLSTDGGTTWQNLQGGKVNKPIYADDVRADLIIRGDEFDSHAWLANMMAKDGKLHFLYTVPDESQNPATYPQLGGVQHYVRYDLRTGQRDVDIHPMFKGQGVSLYGRNGTGGFFASRGSQPDAPLYCVTNARDRNLACLRSDDNGASWHDYAVRTDDDNTGDNTDEIDHISGCRELTDDGYIIGCFSMASSAKRPGFHFFRIPTRSL